MAKSEQVSLNDMMEQYANRLEEAVSSGELAQARATDPQSVALLYELVGFLRAAAKASIKVNMSNSWGN